PGKRPTISFAGTRLSEQPIQRYRGACCRESRLKKPGSRSVSRAAHARLLVNRSGSVLIYTYNPRQMIPKRKRVLVVGMGNLGMSHGKAYAKLDGFDIAGVCARRIGAVTLPPELSGAPTFTSFDEALARTQPDVVSINTFP